MVIANCTVFSGRNLEIRIVGRSTSSSDLILNCNVKIKSYLKRKTPKMNTVINLQHFKDHKSYNFKSKWPKMHKVRSLMER